MSLDGILGWRIEIDHLPDHTVSTFTDDILNLVLIGDVERDLAR